MSLREALGVALRVLRTIHHLSQDDLHCFADAKHIHSIEHAKIGISLEMLEGLATSLGTPPLAFIALGTKFQSGQSRSAQLSDLKSELTKLESIVMDAMSAEFAEGKLITHCMNTISQEKLDAVSKCRAQGMSRKEASEALCIPQTTVNRL